jgi:hypothetical protein
MPWESVKHWLGYTPPGSDSDDNRSVWQALDARILHRVTQEEWEAEGRETIPGAFMRSSPVMCVSIHRFYSAYTGTDFYIP